MIACIIIVVVAMEIDSENISEMVKTWDVHAPRTFDENTGKKEQINIKLAIS